MTQAEMLPGAPSFTIYFYHPEISVSRNVVLKKTFDSYLKDKGDFRFQPVSELSAFERLLQDSGHSLFIMSDWRYRKNVHLTPLLRGVKQSSSTFVKVLVSRERYNSGVMGQVTVAAASSEGVSRELLSQIKLNQSGLDFAQIKLLKVPKDIDAVMAVGFGLADAALTTESSLAQLSELDENQYKQLHIVGKSQPLKRMVVVSDRVHAGLQEGIVESFRDMHGTTKGKIALKLLGLDAWQLIDSPDIHQGGQK